MNVVVPVVVQSDVDCGGLVSAHVLQSMCRDSGRELVVQ